MCKEKGYNSSYVYCQVKRWSKKRSENFLNDFGKSFWNGMMEGEKMESHQKRYFWSWSVFLLLEYWLPLYLKRLLELFFFFLFFSFFLCSIIFLSLSFYAPSLEDFGGFDDIWGEKSFLQKLSFQMEWHGHDCEYTGGGHIFRNEVMHTNIAKPWLWRCESCGYIGGGCIFRSGGIHANISGCG